MYTELSIVNEIVLNFRCDSKTWNKCKRKKARKTFLGCTNFANDRIFRFSQRKFQTFGEIISIPYNFYRIGELLDCKF